MPVTKHSYDKKFLDGMFPYTALEAFKPDNLSTYFNHVSMRIPVTAEHFSVKRIVGE